MKSEYEYDIAISFLSQDEPLALKLSERLSEQLRVFVYSKRQEDLAATDGLESFGTVFRSQAYLAVVLYRNGWGQTKWTRIEETAIKERVFNDDGWRSLFFVGLDKASTLPKWLHETYLRFDFEEYGLEQLVGAIKARLQEVGGTLKPLDVVQHAKLVEKKQVFYAEKKRLFNSPEGVQAVRQEVADLFARITNKVEEIKSSTSIQIKAGSDNHQYVVKDERISVSVIWRLGRSNSLEHSSIAVWEYNSPIKLPGQDGLYLIRPVRIKEHQYLPEYSDGQGWCWKDESKPNEFLSSIELADRCVSFFLKLAELVASGQLEPPPDSFE